MEKYLINTLTLQELLKGLCNEMHVLLIFKIKLVLGLMDITKFAALLIKKFNIKVCCLYENQLITMQILPCNPERPGCSFQKPTYDTKTVPRSVYYSENVI